MGFYDDGFIEWLDFHATDEQLTLSRDEQIDAFNEWCDLQIEEMKEVDND